MGRKALRATVLWAVLAAGLALGQQVVTLRAWTIGPEDASRTRATNLVAAAEELNKVLEAQGAAYRVRVETSFETTNWDNYHRRLLLAFQSGQAPDIVQTTHVDIGAYAEGGYIVPLDEYLGRYRSFAEVTPELWKAVTYRGKRYGVPQDTEARPLYFNKTLLAKLGWSRTQIEGLPQSIREGRFTWEDLIRVGQEAVQKGVVRSGYAYWHRPVNGADFYQFYYACGGVLQDTQSGKLVLDRSALGCMYGLLARLVQTGVMSRNLLGMTWDNWHNAVSSGQVLFASAGTWTWAQWATQYYAKDHGGYSYLWQNFGFALQPALKAGGRPVTLSQPQAYLVTAASRSKDLAVRLLSMVTQPKYDAQHALGSAHLPVLRTTYVLPEVRQDRFLQAVRYMLDYTTYQAMSPDWGVYAEAVFRGISAVESGQLAPEAAVDLVAKDLAAKLGDRVVVR
ncbi:MAG: extracellular solute-binding protein [Thermus sp.]|uniref:sugar ABC transporter substrate-binding protein n=1 Tax=Thermus sp. TaxID=275 RepID=UPI00351AB4EE